MIKIKDYLKKGLDYVAGLGKGYNQIGEEHIFVGDIALALAYFSQRPIGEHKCARVEPVEILYFSEDTKYKIVINRSVKKYVRVDQFDGENHIYVSGYSPIYERSNDK